jgi:hypothetical protein
MSIARTFSFVVVAAVSTLAVGCSSADEGAPSSGVTLTGKVGSGSTATRTFGGVSASDQGLHVVARKLHRKGEPGRNVDVAVGSDGTFRIDVARGSRYVITVDSADAKSAMISFAGGKNVVAVQAGEGGGQVDVGGVKIVGGEAYTDLAIDGKLGLSAALADLDEVFEAADGAIASVREAAEEARKAADVARAAAEDARDAAEKAREAAEKARRDAEQAAKDAQP